MKLRKIKPLGFMTRGAEALAIMLMLAGAPTVARAAACGATISACCKIKTAGTFTVTSSFNASATGICIDVIASGAILDGDGHTITGPGDSTASGIMVESTAGKTIISDVDANSFGLGVRVDGPRAILFHVTTNSGGKGKLINAPRAYLDFADANGNTGYGIKATANAANLTIIDTFNDSNDGPGFRLQDVTGAHINGIAADDNGTFGVWFDGASANSMVSFEAEDNSVAGVYLGCNSGGPTGVPCPAGRKPSSDNLISGAWVNGSVTNGVASSNSKFGVAIDTGSLRNLVTWTTSEDNTDEDMIDKNTNCGSNTWQFNTFTNSSPAPGTTPFCID